MKLENLEVDLPMLYERAINSYRACIYNKDNLYLNEEVNIPLEEIIVGGKSIKIVYNSTNFSDPIFEVCLLLFDESLEIGKYTYLESVKKEAVDDFLVFY